MHTTRKIIIAATALMVLFTGPVNAATTTYRSGSVTLPITDRTATSRAIKVRAGGTVKDVNVYVRLDHGATADLDLYLVSPRGVVVQLSTNNGGGADYGTGADTCTGKFTVFDDEAPQPIYMGGSPFTGSWRPEQPLTVLDGKSQKGTWRLIIGDNTANSIGGTLFCWKLRITV